MIDKTINKFLSILIILTIFGAFVSFASPQDMNTDLHNQKVNKQNNTDITNWNIDTNWTYEQKIWINYTAKNYIRLNESITYEVSEIGYHNYNGSKYYSYNLTLDGNISGGYGIMDGYDLQINGGDISGYMLCRVSDQGMIVDYQHRDMYGEIYIRNFTGWVDFDAVVNSTRYYHKVVETYDFPMNTNETFWGNTTLETSGDYKYTAMGGAYSDSDSVHNYSKINQTNSVGPSLKQVEVPYGNYSTYHVDNNVKYNKSNDNNHIQNWYNETIGSYVKQTADLTSGDSDIFWIRKLSGHHKNNTDNTCNITPNVQKIGNETVISGVFSKYSDTNLTVTIPSSSDKKSWSVKTNSSGYYNTSITVPLAPDNTPTNQDFSSVGVIVRVEDNPNVFAVSTLTVLPDQIKPKITDLTNGNPTTGDNFTFNARVTDNADLVKYVKIKYWYGDSISNTASMEKIIMGNEWNKNINLPLRYKGLDYQFIASDTFNNINKSKIYSIDIIDNDPPELRDKTKKQAIPGTNFTFKATASDNIKLDKVYVNYSTHKSNFSNLTMSVVGDDTYERDVHINKDSTSLTYELSSKDTNGNWRSLNISQIPVEDTRTPNADAGEDITVNASEIVHLSGKGSVDNVGIVNYTWFVDGDKFYGSTITFKLSELGYHYAELTVKDAAGNKDKDRINISVVDEIKPNASAGKDRIVKEDTKVHFDGSSSKDNAEILSYTWIIEDKILNGVNINYTFSSPGSYKVVLKVTDISNNQDKDIINITVKDTTQPVIIIDYNKTIPEDTLTTFNASSSYDNHDIKNIVWNIDGVKKYGALIEHTFEDPGEKNININISDFSNNYNSRSFNINVKDITKPVINIDYNETISEDTLTTFNASSSYDNHEIKNIVWNIDGVKKYGTLIEHTFEDPGEKNIKINISDSSNNYNSRSFNINVKDTTSPNAVSKDNLSVDIGENFTLNAGKSNDNYGIKSYEWIIENKILSGENITYSYDQAGEYKIILRVIDFNNNKDNCSVKIDVNDLTSPKINLHENITVNINENITLQANKIEDNGKIKRYIWEVKDKSYEQKTRKYSFNETGIYKVKLTVIDCGNNSAQETINIKVIDIETPEAYIKKVKKSRKEFVFDATNSTDNGNLVSYQWNFGEGKTTQGEKVTHKFDETGTYKVTLIVEDGAGNTDEITKTIKVEKKDKDAPGFAFPLLIISISFTLIYLYYRDYSS